MTWKTYRIEQIVEDIQSGFACGDKDVINGYQHLRMNNIHPDGKLDLTLLRRVPPNLVTPKYRLHKGDMIVCTTNSGKLVGKSALFDIDGDYTFSNHLTRLRLKQDIVDPAFVQKMIWLKWQLGEIEPLCKHWVNQSTLPKEALLALEFQIPSLDDQRRIAGKLDRIAAHLDEVKARLATIPTLLKRFRQSILAAACSGRLTEDWRASMTCSETSSALVERIVALRCNFLGKRKPIMLPTEEFSFESPDSWAQCSMDSLTCRITSGSRDWKQFYRNDGGGTFVMAQNVRPMRFDLSSRQGVEPPLNDRDRERSQIAREDILVTIVGANTGDSCRVTQAVDECYVCQSVALMRPVLAETSPFIELFLNSSSHGLAQYRTWIYGEGRPHLSFDHLRMTRVLVPPIEEQHEIVRRVRILFQQADAIEARYNKAVAFVDKLMPAILAKAFRGELA
ncbi:MAG TPA: restriction endonuclease subunit S [Candidatus Ozemobacteraceae bacterium]